MRSFKIAVWNVEACALASRNASSTVRVAELDWLVVETCVEGGEGI